MTESDFQELLIELRVLNQTHGLIANYLRILAYPEIEKRLSKIFPTSKELRVYELSDGTKTTRDIEDTLGISRQTVSVLWQKWLGLGIVEDMGDRKPHKSKYLIVDLALGNAKTASHSKKESDSNG